MVVPGHGARGGDGVYRITARCRQLVAEAQKLAEALSPAAIVFGGWSPEGPSEAEQMRELWCGPPAPLVVEPTARTTAENASRTLPLLLDRQIDAAVVVCAAPHLLRARLFFGRLYGARGVVTQLQSLRTVPPLESIAWELAALPLCPWQLRAARAELERRAA